MKGKTIYPLKGNNKDYNKADLKISLPVLDNFGFIDVNKLKADPRYAKEQVNTLKRVIERCKKANDINGVKFYTELLEKGGVESYNDKDGNYESISRDDQ
jgi:hypothetical protein